MEIKLIKTFITIAQTKSFSQTAELLNYAQSSISDQIKKLEQSLDTSLFERLGNHIRLTEDGEIFLEYGEKILNLCDEAYSAISEKNSNTISGEIRIAITETLCFYKLPRLLQDYRTLYPDVDIKIKMGNCYDFPSWLRKNIIDIAYVLDDEVHHEDIVTEQLFQEPLILVVSKDHTLASNKYVTPDMLEKEHLILTQKGSKYRALFDKYLSNHNIYINSCSEFESVEAIKHFVLNNLGISFMPYSIVEKELNNGSLIKIPIEDTEFCIPAQVLYHNKKWMSPALRSLLDLTYKTIK